MANSNPHIPVIDFERLNLNRSDELIKADDLQNIGTQIKDAFEKVGFCYLKNFGTNPDIVDRYFTVSRDVFSQADDEKAKHSRTEDCNFGWVCVERERLNPDRPADLKEAFNYHPASDPDDWPTKEFQQASQTMFSYCKRLSERVCDALSVGLGLGTTFLRDAHKLIGQEKNETALRTLFYPPIPEGSSIKPGQIRLGEHSDYGTITILFQDDIGGLEVEVPGTGYVPATPIPGTVIVNIGDLMQRWTSDKLTATKHRVFIPEVEFKRKTYRQSVVFFVHPDDDYIIRCLDGSDKYEPVSSIDYLNYRFSVTY